MTRGPENRIFDAKFRMPSSTKTTINRPRLFAQLEDAGDCKLLVITAPAGFGKTTLISSWLRSASADSGAGRPCFSRSAQYAWLSLDERENHLGAFVGHFIGAIQQASPGITFETADILQIPAYPPVSDIARALVADLAHLPGDLTLVLDDYHVVHEPLVHSLLDMLVAYSPEQFRLILLTRHDPPLPVARLCLQGRARQLRASDLRFRADEAAEFFKVALPVAIPGATLAAVTEQAGGWIAQLRLAALLLRQSPDQVSPDTVRDLAMDYLMEELLASEPAAVRAFLLATSVLERFSASLAAAMLEPLERDASGEVPSLLLPYDRNPAQVFRYVVQAGLFVTELDSGRVWYRYHDLFRELLYQRLQWEYPAEILVLRRRAFEWLQTRGYVEEAIAQAQAMGDEQAIGDLVEAHALAAIQNYQWQTAQRWIDLLAPETIRARPALLLAHSYVLLNAGAVERVGMAIRWAEQLLKDARSAEPGRQDRLWLGTLELVRADYFSLVNRLDDSLVAAKHSLELLPADCLFERTFATLRMQSLLAHEGKFEEGREMLRALLREAVDERAPWVTRIRIGLALNYARAGDFHRAKREIELVQHLFSHGQAYNECWSRYLLGRIAYEWNDLDSATEHFRCAARSHGGNYMRAFESLLGLALTAEARGQREEAAQALDQALAMAKALRSEDLVTLALSFRTRLLLIRGEPGPAMVHLAPSVRQDRLILFMPIEIPRLTEARRLLSSGRPADLKVAQRMMEETVDFMGSVRLQIWLPQALALLALIYRARDQRSRALETLARSVQLATPASLIRSFIDFGPDMTGLLYELKLTGTGGDHVAAILSAAAGQPTRAAARDISVNLIEPLTTRELAVLELLVDSMSDKEIAATLCISPLTVRKHTSNIFQKLAVRNRRQAAASAMRLGLVRSRPRVAV